MIRDTFPSTSRKHINRAGLKALQDGWPALRKGHIVNFARTHVVEPPILVRLLLVPALLAAFSNLAFSAEPPRSTRIYHALTGIGSPAVVAKDVNGNGKQELFVTSLNGWTHGFDSIGVRLPGFPIPYPTQEQG